MYRKGSLQNVCFYVFLGILPREVEDSRQHGTGHETERIPEQNQVQAVKEIFPYKQ